jgi:lysophospholipase L1-like esterase
MRATLPRSLLLFPGLLLGAASTFGATWSAPATEALLPDEHSTAINTAIIPVPKLETDSYDWWKRHQDELASKDQIHPQVVLIGDSITHFWGGEPKASLVRGPIAWKEAWGDMRVLNLGFGYDRTQNVLWRLDHGEFDGLFPKWVVINIGTNNINGTAHARGNSAPEIVAAILAICDRVHAKAPGARIIVMAIFPRGQKSTDPLRHKIRAVNDLLQQSLKARPAIIYLDIGAQFLRPDGTLPKDIMFDGTHPTEKGYSIWAKALREAISPAS